ncbi:helix-turn-helix transcriptional regulator [Streptomyces sp. NPDC048290]|uniref:helix-turn-helix domain-containing protein n=1 Tax=Streptomyces sp. NPDC048290 TaxID=3155811 RepID=UPI00343F8FA9
MSYPTDRPTESVGSRIRALRLIRDYSLSELGRMAHVSKSQLSRVENGEQPASPSVLAAVARALSVDISVLHGQPYIKILQQEQLDAMVSPIGSALEAWDIELDDDPEPRSFGTLQAEVDRVVGLRIGADFSETAKILPGLITEVASAVRRQDSPGYQRERLYALQAELARTAASVSYRLGYADLARLAVARMGAAARESGDPCLVAIERFERAAITHGSAGRADRSVALIRQALRELDDDGSQAVRAVRGILVLRAATYARRTRDTSAADSWIEQANEIAETTGDVDLYALSFGPRWVRMSQVSDLNDTDDHDEALRRARELRLPDDYPPNRRAHFWINRARAEAWTARHDDALDSLVNAREAAPQMTRFHPEVHETVGTLLRARTRAPESLREFAAWSGV